MKHRLIILVPLVLLAALIGWRIVGKREEVAAQMNQRAARAGSSPPVSVAPAEVRDVIKTFDAVGGVEAPLDVKIAAKLTGRIESLQLREGDRVRKGQVLVRFDPSEVEANVQQQMANLAETQYRLAQAQLNQGPANVSVNTQIRQQKAAVDSANADYNQVRENYKAQLAAAAANLSDAQSRVENAQAVVKSAEANLANAQARYDRKAGLLKQGFISPQEAEDAKTEVAAQQAALDVAQGQVKSALSQKEAVQQQSSIVKTKGSADIEAARAKVSQAEAALEYANASSAQKPAYEQSLAALQSSVAAARASLRSAEARRADTVLKSPLDGVVTARYVDPGAIATPGQAIISVQFVKQIWVTVSVPEEIIPKVHMGQAATVTLDALPGRTFAASVIQINPSADPESRQFTVRVIMSNDAGIFKPGMFARVALETDRVKRAVVVPREAVQRDKLGSYVMVVDETSTARRRPVVTGVQDVTGIAIEDGLRPGEKVIILSAFPVRDGQPINLGGGKPKQGAR